MFTILEENRNKMEKEHQQLQLNIPEYKSSNYNDRKRKRIIKTKHSTNRLTINSTNNQQTQNDLTFL